MSGGGEKSGQEQDTGFLGYKRLNKPLKASAHAYVDWLKGPLLFTDLADGIGDKALSAVSLKDNSFIKPEPVQKVMLRKEQEDQRRKQIMADESIKILNDQPGRGGLLPHNGYRFL